LHHRVTLGKPVAGIESVVSTRGFHS
jgi:hypothetical protein